MLQTYNRYNWIYSLVKNKGVKLPFVTKNKNNYDYLVTFAYKNKTIFTSTYFVNLKIVSNLKSLLSSKICPLN